MTIKQHPAYLYARRVMAGTVPEHCEGVKQPVGRYVKKQAAEFLRIADGKDPKYCVNEKRLAYEESRLFEVNVENARCTYDTNMNRYINKKRSNGKVDCVMAVVDALYLLQQNELLDADGGGFVCQVG